MPKQAKPRKYIYPTDDPKKWVVQLDYLDPLTGKRMRPKHTIYGRMGEAEDWGDQQLDLLRVGVFPSADVMTVSELLDRWASAKRTGSGAKRVTEKTLSGYRPRIKALKKVCGGAVVKQMTPLVINQIAEKLSQQHADWSDRTLKYTLGTLKTALNDAVAWEIIGRNPARHLATDTRTELRRPKRKEAMPKEHLERYLENLHAVCTHADKPVYKDALLLEMIVYTGLRRGEAAGLTWNAIEWDNRVLHIRSKVNEIDGKSYFEMYLKTDSGQRDVVVPEWMMNALADHREEQNRAKKRAGEKWHNEHDLVFTTRWGGVLSMRSLVRKHHAVLRRAGLPRGGEYKIHRLRDTFATMLAEGGVNPRTLQRILGHADVQTTLNMYVHPTRTMHKEAADIIDRKVNNRFRGETSEKTQSDK